MAGRARLDEANITWTGNRGQPARRLRAALERELPRPPAGGWVPSVPLRQRAGRFLHHYFPSLDDEAETFLSGSTVRARVRPPSKSMSCRELIENLQSVAARGKHTVSSSEKIAAPEISFGVSWRTVKP
jgi:hypothetical protein